MFGARMLEIQQALRLLSPAGWRQFAQARESFRELLQTFYVEGGLTVATGVPQASGDGPPIIRTVIQADGDLLSFLTLRCLEQPEYWKHHREAIQKELKRIQGRVARLEATLYGLATLLSPLPILGFYQIWSTSVTGWLKTLLNLLAWGLMFAILRVLIHRIGLYLIRRKLPLL